MNTNKKILEMPPKSEAENRGENRGKFALITGASSGIGYELTQLFARDGYGVVMVARDEKRLLGAAAKIMESSNVPIKTIAIDLALPGAPFQLYQDLKRDNYNIEYLVNNAGFGGSGKFAETDWDYENMMIQVNIVALSQLTKLFLKDMAARNSGRIMNLASIAGFQAGPLMSVYYATKSYVLLFSEALANEMKGTGISITALCPGPTRTEFQSTAGVEKARLFRSIMVMSAEKVAKIGYKGMMAGKTVVIPGILNKIMIESERISPRKMVTSISRFLTEKR